MQQVVHSTSSMVLTNSNIQLVGNKGGTIVSMYDVNSDIEARRSLHRSPITRTEKVWNNTSKGKITLAFRDGFKATASDRLSVNVKGVIIVTEYSFNAKDLKEMVDYFEYDFKGDQDYKEIVLDQLRNLAGLMERPLSAPSRISVKIVRIVDEEKLINDNVYVAEADIMLSIGTIEGSANHPYSNTTLMHEQYDATISRMPGVVSGFDLVDNGDNIGEQWVWIGNTVAKIKPIKDPNRLDGLYWYMKRGNDPRPILDYYSGKTAIGKIMYPTKKEALTAGNPELLAKRKLKELSRKSKETDIKFKKEKAELEKIIHELKIENEKRKLEHAEKAAILSLEDHRMKRQHESMKYSSEQTSIGMKMVVAVVTGVVAIGTAIAKLFF